MSTQFWAEVGGAESAQIVGGDALQVSILEGDPRLAGTRPGETVQRVRLLVHAAERLDPPTRMIVRGVEMRVLSTQMPPWPDEPSIVTCERVNPNLPDLLRVLAVGERVLDPESGRFVEGLETEWEGAGHVVSGVPQTVDSAGEDAPLDRVTVTLPLTAPYASGLRVEVVESRTPGLVGRHFTASGEILDSDAELRRFVAYRPGA